MFEPVLAVVRLGFDLVPQPGSFPWWLELGASLAFLVDVGLCFVTAYQDCTVDTIGGFLGEDNREKWDYINKPFTEGEILQKARFACSLWDLHRLKQWQEERLSEAHQLLLLNEKQNTVAAVGRSFAHEFGSGFIRLGVDQQIRKGE